MPTVAVWRKRIQAVGDSFPQFVTEQALALLPETGSPHLSDLMVAAMRRRLDMRVTELLNVADREE